MDVPFSTSTIAVIIFTGILIALTALYLTNTSNKMTNSSKELYTSTLEPPIPTPTYGAGGSFTVLARTFIPHTTPGSVLSAIRDTSTWAHWNGFTPHFTFSPLPSPDSKTSTTPSSEPGIPPGKEGWLNLGSQGSMSVHMSGNGLEPGAKKSRSQEMVITILEPLSSTPSSPSPLAPSSQTTQRKGYRIAWKSLGYAHWQLHSERVTELVEIDEDEGEGRKGTEYVCWETFGGALAPVVKLAVGGQLRERFGEYAGGLRGFCFAGKGGMEGEIEGEGE
ncbi:hypothetical protein BKA65DRAFT_535351 [Rhexocercosporidium sp. MPI-PUGE-AT-0058]|nr:hypothetical protein BKA65DRAFT_535351 [Rhexocercosporidium sp. MPI-PUGE-AT-0058]